MGGPTCSHGQVGSQADLAVRGGLFWGREGRESASPTPPPLGKGLQTGLTYGIGTLPPYVEFIYKNAGSET